MFSSKEDSKKESMRLANHRVRTPLSKEMEEARDLLYGILANKGYIVKQKHAVWAIITKATGSEYAVQLEIEPEGSNLDIVLLSDSADELDINFPLGGSWACKSSVKLVAGNIRFAVERIESFFGVVHEGRDHMEQNWESVQKHLNFESFLRVREQENAS